MSERMQWVLWVLLTVVAVALAGATAGVCAWSRHITAGSARSAYGIVYVSDRSGLFQLYGCASDGSDSRKLSDGRTADGFPVGAPSASSGGGAARVAFLSLESDPAHGSQDAFGAPGSLQVLDLGTGTARELSGSVAHLAILAPSWSPDGSQVAFAGAEDLNRDGKYGADEQGIYVADVKSGRAARVVSVSLMGARLLWSPVDDRDIVPVKKEGSPVPECHVLDGESGRLSPIGSLGSTTVACWSPNGQHIASYAIHDQKIHLYDASGSEAYTLEPPPGYLVDLLWTITGPGDDGYSPGRLLAISASEASTGATPGRLFSRSAGAARSGKWLRLAPELDTTFWPAVSPDGKHVAFSAFTGADNADLYVLDLQGHQPVQLTSDPGFEGLPTWIPGSAP